MEVKDFSSVNVLTQNLELGNVKLVDSDDEYNLKLYCYTKCSNSDTDFIKQCRGLVFNNEKLIMKAFPYADEYAHTEMAVLEKILENFSKWSFYPAYEGALLRLFFFSGRWFLTTHRKLNAFRSRWSSKETFGTLFKRALEHEKEINKSFRHSLKEGENILDQFQSTLDKNKQYMFLLRNNSENRIVCNAPSQEEPFMYHVGTFVDGVLSMNENINISRPSQLVFLNIDELVDYIETKVSPTKTQGVVCFGPNNRQIKILHESYKNLYGVRGNVPNVNFRYLELRTNSEQRKHLCSLYPNLQRDFDEIEQTIKKIGQSIYDAYESRFKNHEYTVVPKDKFHVMKRCHEWHLSDKRKNRVDISKVMEELNKQPPIYLNYMIKAYK